MTVTVPIYPAIVREQDLTPDHFGSDIDELCQEIRDGTKVRTRNGRIISHQTLS